MVNTKLLKLLATFSSNDMRLLRSHILNNHKSTSNIFKLFSFINKWHPNFEELTTQSVYKKVFGYDAFDTKGKGRLHELISRLYKNTEFFLIKNEIYQDDLLYDTILSQALKKRGLDDLLIRHNEVSKKKINDSTFLRNQDYEGLYKLSNDSISSNAISIFDLKYNEKLNEIESYLDHEFLSNKLNIMTKRLTTSSLLELEPNDDSLFLIDIDTLKNRINDNPIMSAYIDVIQMFENGNLKDKLSLVIKDTSSFDAEEQLTLLRLLSNYFQIQQYKNNDYSDELLYIYIYMADNGLLTVNNNLSNIDFLDAITSFAQNGKYGYAEKVMNLSTKFPMEGIRDSRHLAKAIIDFEKKRYFEVIQQLSHIPYENIKYKLLIRTLNIKASYEIKDIGDDFIFYNLKAAREFIRRNEQLSKKARVAYRNFFSFVRLLSEYPYNSKDMFLGKLDNYELIAERKWCKEKILELK